MYYEQIYNVIYSFKEQLVSEIDTLLSELFMYILILYHMKISHKNQTNTAFLDRFLGKTSRLGKNGISGVIAQARTETK